MSLFISRKGRNWHMCVCVCVWERASERERKRERERETEFTDSDLEDWYIDPLLNHVVITHSGTSLSASLTSGSQPEYPRATGLSATGGA